MTDPRIKPFHLFDHGSKHYLINIEDMQACLVDETTVKTLELASTGSDKTLQSNQEAALAKLGLIAEGPPKKASAMTKDIPIVSMALLVTQSCNLKCVYCYGDGGKYGTGGHMAEHTALQSVDWLIEKSQDIKHLHIMFFGGEPFLNFALIKTVVQYAEAKARALDKNPKFHITTNGTLLDDEQIAFIKEHHIAVMVSFDGPKELQDAQRPYANGQGSYASVVPKIRDLLAVLPNTPAHAVVVGRTDPNLVKAALEDIGFSNISLALSSQSLFSTESGTMTPTRDPGSMIAALEEESDRWIHLIECREGQALKALAARSALFPAMIALLHNARRKHACGAGRGLVAVSNLGDIYLCHRFVGMEEYRLGSIYDQDLNRGDFQTSPIEMNAACAACFARYYCAGGCKHDNASSCGFVFKPDENMCSLKRRELELAATIICQLGSEERAFLLEEQVFPPKPCMLDF